jgi:hypothetical protein
MLRHACGFKLANDGHDTRALQHYLGHKNIQHTVKYTDMAPNLAIREDALGPEHPDTATALNNLANLFRDQGDYAETRPLLECALAILEKARGPWHPDTAY